jgi:hypothetical protein
MKRMKENTIAQFFTDTGFQPPKGHNMFDFNFGFDGGGDDDLKQDGYDGIPSNVADIVGDLHDTSQASEHPLPSIYGDFYMFNDPGSRNNPDLRIPPSMNANQTNTEYHKKDLSKIDSASDVHLETLEQPVAEFPRHQQMRSQMEPSVIGPIDQSGVQPPQPGEIVLEKPQILEGIEYPVGTRILVEMSAEEAMTEDELFENPHAKLCPLCYEPYLGDVCPACEAGKPGPDAVRV